jgi:F-type H+-transporting ATPase subunit delta
MRAKRKVRRAARQLFRLCLTGGVLEEDRAREVARTVAASSRRLAPAVLTEFLRLVHLDRSRSTAVVESAVPLPGSLRDQVQADLARVYGPTVRTSFTENAALLGGMRIRVGSDVYDGSVRARLDALAARV